MPRSCVIISNVSTFTLRAQIRDAVSRRLVTKLLHHVAWDALERLAEACPMEHPLPNKPNTHSTGYIPRRQHRQATPSAQPANAAKHAQPAHSLQCFSTSQHSLQCLSTSQHSLQCFSTSKQSLQCLSARGPPSTSVQPWAGRGGAGSPSNSWWRCWADQPQFGWSLN